ncbi:hypothetical protein P170DRAFT_13957 [Aspergillus steynii IBT 23096]|uniref:Type 1 phosphatases regulator n=1 Tax=Aspergillus steynii IBT 23096 TaxID=1392250 RepID=A0A2I2GN60_9EURO|nr:uncharacterized protein P170DRAFT_13957 [Aspergillus steynii IBT 23096]PLB54315.1 hypothetical protein P170DRAFT_13957 [Aspergillus steynii IBT 23096]
MSRSLQTPLGGPSSGSQTQSISRQPAESSARTQGTLRLRAENDSVRENDLDGSTSRRIRWSEDVVDNEGMGKKSSKVCCIYHKNRPVGESSSESESSDSSSNDSDSDCERDQRGSGNGSHDHGHGPSNQSQQTSKGGQSNCPKHHGKYKQRKRSPNAYEKMPKTNKGR